MLGFPPVPSSETLRGAGEGGKAGTVRGGQRGDRAHLMEIDKLKALIKRLSMIGVGCVTVLGVVVLLTNYFLDVNYLHQFQKYRALKVGMSKEVVQQVLGKGEPISNLPAEIKPNSEADEVLTYLFILGSESGGYFVVFYKQNQLIEKEAFANGAPLFTENREGKQRTGSVWRIIYYIIVIFIGFLPLWICMKIARGNSLIQNKGSALLGIIIYISLFFFPYHFF